MFEIFKKNQNKSENNNPKLSNFLERLSPSEQKVFLTLFTLAVPALQAFSQNIEKIDTVNINDSGFLFDPSIDVALANQNIKFDRKTGGFILPNENEELNYLGGEDPVPVKASLVAHPSSKRKDFGDLSDCISIKFTRNDNSFDIIYFRKGAKLFEESFNKDGTPSKH